MNEYLAEYISLGLFSLVSLCFLFVLCLLFFKKSNKKSAGIKSFKSPKALKKSNDTAENFKLHFNHWIEFIILFFLFLFFLLFIPFFSEIGSSSKEIFFTVILIIFFVMIGFGHFIKTLEKEKNNE